MSDIEKLTQELEAIKNSVGIERQLMALHAEIAQLKASRNTSRNRAAIISALLVGFCGFTWQQIPLKAKQVVDERLTSTTINEVKQRLDTQTRRAELLELQLRNVIADAQTHFEPQSNDYRQTLRWLKSLSDGQILLAYHQYENARLVKSGQAALYYDHPNRMEDTSKVRETSLSISQEIGAKLVPMPPTTAEGKSQISAAQSK